MKEYDVRAPGPDTLAVALSGGNQQKLIVGREMSPTPRLLIAAHPTRGVDVGAQAAIWELLKDARAEGMGILLISADLDELIGLSDTLQVMLRGRLVATLDPATCTPEQLGGHMTGATARRVPHERRLRRLGPALLAPVLAVVVALVISSLVMAALAVNPLDVFEVMLDFGDTPEPAGHRDRGDHQPGDPAVPRRPRGGDRLPHGPVQHRRRGPVPARDDRRRRRGRAVALPGPLHVLLIVVVAMLVGGGLGRHRRRCSR